MSVYAAGVGSILLPDKQLTKIDEMRKDTLDRVHATAGKVSTAVIVGSLISAASTLALVKSAYDLSRRRA